MEWCCPGDKITGKNPPDKECGMASVTLSATPKGNGYQATVTYSDGVAISSAEAFPTQAEAISAAALRLLDMPERLERFDAPEDASTDAGMAS